MLIKTPDKKAYYRAQNKLIDTGTRTSIITALLSLFDRDSLKIDLIRTEVVEMEVKNPSELNFSSYSATLEEDLLMEEIFNMIRKFNKIR